MADKALKAKVSAAVEEILSNWDCTVDRILPNDLHPRVPTAGGNKRLIGEVAPMLPPSDWSKNFVFPLREISKLTIGKMPMGLQFLQVAVLERQSDTSHNYRKVGELLASDVKRAVELVKKEQQDVNALADTLGSAGIERNPAGKGKEQAAGSPMVPDSSHLRCTVNPKMAREFRQEMAKKEAELEEEEVEPLVLIVAIEENWEIDIDDCLSRTPLDVRPFIHKKPKERTQRQPHPLSPPPIAYDPNWEATWRASVPGPNASKKEMKTYMEAQAVVMAADPEWDFKNPMDWDLLLLHLLTILSKVTNGQHRVVQMALVEAVRVRQKTKYAKKTDELQPGDVIRVLKDVLGQVLT
ncbi:hypothetical protein BU16DRAFT_539799 [Lophium mytilinum]|uniref:Uncharacterized protein n=1 Tax=Lophium mytilinum TaxID=390894 RepID=A0A6A6QUC8_9PEZI|nr:hypothetical protein BU16DRAFT_539799 [Lophium mytilinum]